MALGSITLEQKPVTTADKVPVITNWTPMVGYMVLQDDISGLYYFRLIMEVRLDDGSGTLLAKIKQRRNGYGPDITDSKARAFFDLRDIVNSQVVDTVFDQNQIGLPFQSIHTLGSNSGNDSSGNPVTSTLFSKNGDSRAAKTQIQTIYVKAYQQYSDSATTMPTEDDTPSVNETLIYMSASLPLLTPRSVLAGGTIDSTYLQGAAFSKYQASASDDLFLSDLEIDTLPVELYTGVGTGYVNYVQWNDTTNVGDYHTIAFLNDNDEFDSDIFKMRIRYYDSDGSPLALKWIENKDLYGGWKPDNSEATTPSDPMDNKYQILYFGCGPGNLQDQTADTDLRPSDSGVDGWLYYGIQGYDSAGTTKRTAEYFFARQSGSCKGFKVRRLAWKNTVGGYDYFNFKAKSTQTIDVERNTYNTLTGKFNASKWYYNDTMRGKQTRQTTAKLTETLNTDWLTQPQANLIEKLVTSTDVYVVENPDSEYTEPIIVTDSSFVRKTVANDKMIQYTIKIEYSNPLNTNS
tara:strand:+ start:1761 stop:3317 length:1557 start_codon:yes stop_codon:yes gene_type:complete